MHMSDGSFIALLQVHAPNGANSPCRSFHAGFILELALIFRLLECLLDDTAGAGKTVVDIDKDWVQPMAGSHNNRVPLLW